MTKNENNIKMTEIEKVNSKMEKVDAMQKHIRNNDFLRVSEELEKIDISTINTINTLHNTNGETLLCCAIHFEKTEIAKLFIKKGADINISNLNNFSALHECFSMNNRELIQLLFGLNVNMLSKDSDGNNPIENLQASYNNLPQNYWNMTRRNKNDMIQIINELSNIFNNELRKRKLKRII